MQPPNPAELQTPVKGPESIPNQPRLDNMAVNQPQPVNTQTIVQIPDHITAEIERLTKQNAEQKTKYEQELLRLQEDLQKKIDELHKQQQTFIEQQAKIMEKASEKPKEPVKRGIEEILSIQKENIFLEREQQLLRENMLQQEDMITRLRMETEIAKMHSDIAQSEMLRIKGAIKDREIQERINGQHYNRQKPARDRVRSEYPVSTGNQTTRNPLRQERRMRKAESDPYLHDRINMVAEERHQSFRQQARSNRHRQDDTDSLIGESCLVYQDGRVARFQLDEKDDEKPRRRSHGAEQPRSPSLSSIETLSLPPSRDSNRPRHGRRKDAEASHSDEGNPLFRPKQENDPYDEIYQRNLERLQKLQMIEVKADEDTKLEMVGNFLQIHKEKIPSAVLRPKSADEESIQAKSRFLD